MTSVIVVTADPAITVAQDTPALTMVVPVTQFPLNKSGFSLSVELAGSTDFNTVTTAGFYNSIDTLSVNAPVSGHFWYLNVDVDGDNPGTFCRQTATVLEGTAATYIRTQINGSWGAWQPLVTLDPSGRLPAVDGSLLTNVNSGLSSKILNYINGLTLSTAGSTSLFGVAAGAGNDSTNAATIVLASAISKTTNSWSSGNGNGALDAGTVAVSTWYHAFMISDATGTASVDILISLSLTPALPTGFTLYRYIGSMLTGASGNWVQFVQRGNEFLWVTPFSDVVSAISTTALLLALSVPPGLKVNALIRGYFTSSNAAAQLLVNSPDEASVGAIAITGNRTAIAPVVGSSEGNVYALNIRTNVSQQIRAVASVGSSTIDIATYGWVDSRGQS